MAAAPCVSIDCDSCLLTAISDSRLTIETAVGATSVVRLAGADWAQSFKFWDAQSLGKFVDGVDGLLLVERPRTDSDNVTVTEVKQTLLEKLPHFADQIEQLPVTMMHVPEAERMSSSAVSRILADASTVSELQPLEKLLPPHILDLFVNDFQQYRMFVSMASRHLDIVSRSS